MSAEAWVDEFATSGPDFQQAKAAVEVRGDSRTRGKNSNSNGRAVLIFRASVASRLENEALCY